MTCQEKVQLVNRLVNSVVVNCKNGDKGAERREKAAVKALLRELLARSARPEEVSLASADLWKGSRECCNS